ncbi:hypothetical protein KUTeg_016091 [Tegillarca granosa]|uniref:Uncharacterized protein n=1 Tax=Tegillarca granosa TaxID=220873 RepID=A0ABQ9ENQ8_TEGGR|nr:hypothetical protein KUTeg_016091 [Tegillarca granosa]
MDVFSGVNGFTNNNNYLPTANMECNEQIGQSHKRRRCDEDVYCQMTPTNCHGKLLQLWRYDKIKKQFFIAQSFLFTNHQDFCMIQTLLQVV